MIWRKSQNNKKHGSSLILGAKVQMLDKNAGMICLKPFQSKQRQSNMRPVWLLCLPEDGSTESPKSFEFQGKSMFCGHSRKDFRYLWSIFTLHIYIYDKYIKYKD